MLALSQSYLIPVAVSILVFALLLVFFWKFFLKRFWPGFEDARKRMRQRDEEAEKILARAREDSFAIIKRAEKSATELLASTQSAVSVSQSVLQNALEEYFERELEGLKLLSEEINRAEKRTVQDSQEAYWRIMENVGEEIARESRRGVVSFLQFLKEEISREEDVMKVKLAEWNSSAKKEIEEHKREAIRKIEESVFSIIYFVSKEVLGKALSVEQHQGLILDALEEAKKMGFFNK
ncbi:MAG: hypothetical protein A3G49_06700 [Candidatus Sungbacteria bacterium RIFCSPLOWO2_12_FULL_41_11]|uniref:ATP synthase F(0) sector subunit b n=1 Tax=Candidatus Sungbacteria bacterium RIFCSPLOWO2_12_FULL_41_11 TaxID=1802286 RepID=A0A1G2LSA5_9BACT|nr:MAG: hypothetical protein UV01_C0003G0118 [Parcubacteria group bacterium GW2011_GWA2_42_14]OGZ98944.1 MAG: hypothetical protein A3D41_04890 [Candidatus Sungbacteria bacterium RIFCSPHIGHO2_02_FULL_41_12b]OHA14506.1 MAG: hypothetical protein A3G49_06700 [Candidatus Sungbacteria bacterium RIFCSPLOWO2_12_FULL_41_11]